MRRILTIALAALAGVAFAQAHFEFEPGFLYLKNGVKVKPLQDGDGPSPTELDTVKVHYRGFLPDNTEFESTMKTGPATVQVRSAIKCWFQGIQTMRAGGKSRFFCPPETAYGAAGKMNNSGVVVVRPNLPLEFEVELLEVIRGK